MKRHFLLLVSICAMSIMTAVAQDQINLHFADGSVQTFKIADLDSINFTQSEVVEPDEPVVDDYDVTTLTGTVNGTVNVSGMNADMNVNISTTADSIMNMSANTTIMFIIPVSLEFKDMQLTWNEETQLFDYQLDNAIINVKGDAYSCKLVGTISKEGEVNFNAASTEYTLDYKGTLAK